MSVELSFDFDKASMALVQKHLTKKEKTNERTEIFECAEGAAPACHCTLHGKESKKRT